MTHDYDDRPGTAGVGASWGGPEDYEALRPVSPGQHYRSYDEGRAAPNTYYQRVLKYSARPPAITAAYGKPSGLLERKDPGPPPT